MKKLLAVVTVALAVAAGIWIFGRVQLAARLATVPELLPGTTLVLLEAPNLKRTRELWHQSELDQIWREPAVQSWLQKPLGRLPADQAGDRGLEEFLALGPTDLFVALTSLQQNEPKFAGGFHFTARPERVRDFVDRRTASWWPKTKELKRETVAYRQLQIEIISLSRFVFATASFDHWFFAATDVETLKTLLDRAAHLADRNEPSLRDDKTFLAAKKHVPTEFAGMVFLNPQPFVEKLLPFLTMTGQSIPSHQLEVLRSIRSVTAAIGFDHGKMRETDFVVMPRIGRTKELPRSLLGAAGTDAVFYSAAKIQWPNDILSPASILGDGFSGLLNQLQAAFGAHGVTVDDLPIAFADEFEAVCNWPAEERLPNLVAALPVRDPARARKIVDALTSLPIASAEWTREDKDGATILSVQPFATQLPLRPTIVLAPNAIFLGSELAATENLRARMVQPKRELETSGRFREAVALVQRADCAFNYVDTQLLWERLDAALRPLLAIGGTIYPALANGVDLTKIPPPDAITRHLSPIVMSQRFEKEGYVTESVGPVTFRAATLGIGASVAGSLFYLREGLKNGGLIPVASPTAAASPEPTASVAGSMKPSPTPRSP